MFAKAGALDEYISRMRAHFPQLEEADVVHGESTKRLWVLPLECQTAETGTLAQFMSSLGLRTAEEDLDADSDAESDTDSAR